MPVSALSAMRSAATGMLTLICFNESPTPVYVTSNTTLLAAHASDANVITTPLFTAGNGSNVGASVGTGVGAGTVKVVPVA